MYDRIRTERPGSLTPRFAVLGGAVLCATLAASPAVTAADLLASPDFAAGEDAIRALGERLAETAIRNDFTPEKLREMFRTDPSLRVNGADKLLYICTERSPEEDLSGPIGPMTISGEDVFTLHSNPDATKTIYLDFTGHHSVGNNWNHNIQFPAYDTSGNPNEFSSSELFAIATWYIYIVEDFAPFDVDVTTEDPGVEALRRSGSGDDEYGIRCLMTQPTSGFGNGIGGVAFINSFDDSIDNPCFVFNKGNNNGSMTASHEVGHTLGLSHDGLFGNQYHPGDGFGEEGWGPIMGAPFGRQLVHWSNGDYPGATSQQQDVAIITKPANGINTYADEHGDTVATATVLDVCPDPTNIEFQAMIETRADVDAFRFETAAGEASIIVNALHPGQNMDILLSLYNSGGGLIASNNDIDDVDTALTVDLAAGEYVITIDGTDRPDRYSDYGCLGNFFGTLSLPAASGGCNCPEDLNGSGSVDFGDILAVLNAWGNAGGPEDLDGSGTVNFGDILLVLGAWGPC